jgi:hypothetical protein
VPKVTYADGSAKYFDDDGHLHREDGPAVEDADGTECWYRHGQLHRLDGPAVVREGGSGEWWVRGARIPRPEQPLLEHLDRSGEQRVIVRALDQWDPSVRLAELIDQVTAELLLEEPEPRPDADERRGYFTWTPSP